MNSALLHLAPLLLLIVSAQAAREEVASRARVHDNTVILDLSTFSRNQPRTVQVDSSSLFKPAGATWSLWTSWSPCVVGDRMRVRACYRTQTSRCLGENSEHKPCVDLRQLTQKQEEKAKAKPPRLVALRSEGVEQLPRLEGVEQLPPVQQLSPGQRVMYVYARPRPETYRPISPVFGIDRRFPIHTRG